MINLFKKIGLVSAFVASSFAVANAALAGADAWVPGNCVPDQGTTLNGQPVPDMVTCSGVLADIHNQGNDAKRYAGFFNWNLLLPGSNTDIGASLGFSMLFNGKSYACTTPATPVMSRLWQTIQTGQRVNFAITFGTTAASGAYNGLCTSVSVYAGSAIHPL
jgi:hypothetical protein